MKWVGYVMASMFLFQLVLGATIYGNVYDISLEKVSNVKIDINTEPKQSYVSKDGSYVFNVPPGKYTLSAARLNEGVVDSAAAENITVTSEGNFVLDLILFPSFSLDNEMIQEGEDIAKDEQGFIQEEGNGNNIWIVLAFIAVFAFGWLVYKKYGAFLKRKGREAGEEKAGERKDLKYLDDASQIIDILKKQGGRATQKEIRKEIPLSEAKVSLMISELEDKGLVRKIKKGRGNILLLNKK